MSASPKAEDTAEQPELEPGDFPINIQEMMEDYEGQIATMSRQLMLERARTRSVQRELEQIKAALLELQGQLPRPLKSVPERPRKKAQSRKR
jgi:hypothetical protein